MLRPPSPLPLRPLAGLLVAFSLAVSAGGWALFRAQQERLARLELDQLATVATVQARRIADWRRERVGDVRTMIAGLLHAPLAELEAEGPARRHAIEHFSTLCRSYGYRRAQLFDPAGRLLLAIDGNGPASSEPLPGELLRGVLGAPGGTLLAAVADGERSRFVVLGRGGGAGEAPAIVALTVESGGALFPALDPWPVAGSSGASLIVEPTAGGLRAILPDRGGRHRTLRPEPDEAAAALPLEPGPRPMRAEDGARILADLRPIADSPWWLAAWVEADELDKAIAAVKLRVAVGVALALSTLWAGALLLWSRARMRAIESERVQAEDLRALVDHAPDAIVLFDGAGRILEANRALSTRLGVERDGLRGRLLSDFIPAESLRELPLQLPALAEGGHVLTERLLRDADGREVPCEISGGRLPDGRRIAFVRDVGARHVLERRTRLLSRALEESPAPALIADPAGTVEYVNRAYCEATGFAREELIGGRPVFLDAEAGAAESSGAILEEARAGRGWTGERADRRKGGEIFFWSLRVQPITGAAGAVEHLLVVGEDVSERRRQAERFRLALRLVRMGVWEWDFSRRDLWWSDECYELYGVERGSFRPTEGVLTLVHPADRERVERAFRRAVDGGPAFDVEYRLGEEGGGRAGQEVRAVATLLRDSSGVPLAAIGVVLDISAQRAAERALVEAREHSQRAQRPEASGPSERRDAGLDPQAAGAEPRVASAAGDEPEPRATAARVLVVEDVAPLGEMIERMLSTAGYDVRVAHEPESALELAARPGFALDVLLTDLVLPGMDGRELARRLRERLPGLRVVVMSGYSDLLTEASGPGELGADAILPKPFTRARLEEAIESALRRGGASRTDDGLQ